MSVARGPAGVNCEALIFFELVRKTDQFYEKCNIALCEAGRLRPFSVHIWKKVVTAKFPVVQGASGSSEGCPRRCQTSRVILYLIRNLLLLLLIFFRLPTYAKFSKTLCDIAAQNKMLSI